MSELDTNPSTPHEQPAPNLADEIAERLQSVRDSAAEADIELRPPVLALGMSERVGSNWFLDTLSHNVHSHNEPFRQQLHATHPLSTIVSRPSDADRYRTDVMHPYETYWLTNFVVSKYSPQPQLVKETNLFFATNNLLDLFPESKALVLSRCPVGIASSFADNDLFRKWNYAERYNQLKSMTLQPQYEQYGFVFEGAHDPGSLRKLARLIVLNTLLLSSALQDREHLVVKYEDSVLNPEQTRALAAEFLGRAGVELLAEDKDVAIQTNHVFSTRKRKSELDAHLDKDDVTVIDSEVRRLLADSLSVLTVPQYEQAQELLEAGNSSYKATGRMQVVHDEHAETVPLFRPEFEYVTDPESGLRWGNQPVTNGDFVRFLNAMHDEGVPNVINGTQLFVNENMIPARGGRIWFNPNQGTYEVTPGFEDYPIYWVTWLGAAAYARFSGARLPDRQEFARLTGDPTTIDFDTINCDHKLEDANHVGAQSPDRLGIYDRLGNVASWCRDGYSDAPGTVINRYIYGTAWNRDGSTEELQKIKSRPLTGSSRSVGIRLIADEDHALSSAQLAERFDRWFALMSHQKDMARTDRYIVDQLIC